MRPYASAYGCCAAGVNLEGTTRSHNDLLLRLQDKFSLSYSTYDKRSDVHQQSHFSVRGKTTTNAIANNTSKVLGTPELLEAILLQLPARDLLLAQRVCGGWRGTIKHYVLIQQALVFTARPATSLSFQQKPKFNPILGQALNMVGLHTNC